MAVIFGDSDVLKAQFLMQTAGEYQRERASTYLSSEGCLVSHLLASRPVELYDKAIPVAIYITCKFTFDRVYVVQSPHIKRAG